MRRRTLVAGGVVALVAIGVAVVVWPSEADENEWSDYESAPYTAIEVGETYSFVVMSSHCDVTQGLIDGTYWRADPPIPSEEWEGSDVGRLHIVDRDHAEFVNDAGDEADFVRDDLEGVACA